MAKEKSELLQGTLDMLILKTLNGGALHGYQIMDQLQQRSGEYLQVEEGSLYPALHRMERRGWITSEWGVSASNRRARYYKLTRMGRKNLDAATVWWQRFSSAITSVMHSA